MATNKNEAAAQEAEAQTQAVQGAVALSDLDPALATVGQPAEGGCVWFHFDPDNATLPTDAATAMSTVAGFESAGEVSADGVTFSKSVTVTKLKGWHNTTIVAPTTDEDRTVKMTLVEPNRPAAAKAYYGKDGVEAGEDGSVKRLKDIAGTSVSVACVVDELESNGYLRRTVIPKMTIESFDDVQHQRGALVSYGITGSLIKVAGQNLKDVYRAKPAA